MVHNAANFAMAPIDKYNEEDMEASFFCEPEVPASGYQQHVYPTSRSRRKAACCLLPRLPDRESPIQGCHIMLLRKAV